MNLDGEPLEARRLRIDCVPGAVRMVLPRDCPLLAPRPTRAERRLLPVLDRTVDAERL
jgi:hypothetical protein